jgi:hypothetical protein
MTTARETPEIGKVYRLNQINLRWDGGRTWTLVRDDGATATKEADEATHARFLAGLADQINATGTHCGTL